MCCSMGYKSNVYVECLCWRIKYNFWIGGTSKKLQAIDMGRCNFLFAFTFLTSNTEAVTGRK